MSNKAVERTITISPSLLPPVNPTISIGMPVFNGEAFIAPAIESILAQTYTDFELIISDSCSTDRTQEICQEYACRDKRIRYYRTERNYGAAWNHNVVADIARGFYFKWAAQDDVLAPTFLEQCLFALESDHHVALCYPSREVIDTRGRTADRPDTDHCNLDSCDPRLRFKKYLSLQRRSFMRSPMFGLFRRDVLDMTRLIGPYDGSDFILLGHTALLGKIQELPDHLLFHRAHSSATDSALSQNGSRTGRANDTGDHEKTPHPRLRSFDEFVRILGNVRIPLHDKIRCLFYFATWAPMTRHDSRNDHVPAIRWSFLPARYRPAVN